MLPRKIIRKVQSMDGLRIPSVEIKSEWVYPSNPNGQERKASRFSSDANRNRTPRLSSPTHRRRSSLGREKNCCSDWDSIPSCAKLLDSNNTNNGSSENGGLNELTRSTSRSSFACSDVVAEQDHHHHQDMLLFPNGERNVPYVTLFMIVLFLASVSSSYNNKDSNSSRTSFLSPFSSRHHSSRGGGGSGSSSHKNHPNNRLGSAMIETVTDVLSPILPFTGGIDLRRVPWQNWFGILITSSQSSPIESTNSSSNSQKMSLFPRGGGGSNIKSDCSVTLSTNEPFLPTNNIAEMTLNEIAFLFRYAIELNRNGFDSKTFFSQTHEGSPLRKPIIEAMQALDHAVSKSRGTNVLPALTRELHLDFSSSSDNDTPATKKEQPQPLNPEVGYGDVDALQFCAAMRLFAEWRLLRQVPPGYKAYAVGMNLGHKDIVQNVGKIESAVHKWIQQSAVDGVSSSDTVSIATHDCVTEKGGGTTCVGNATESTFIPRSPTLRQLLIHEINMDIHPTSKLPRLKENSAAMGLLWVRRQLHYQTVIFRNIISVPEVFTTVIKAVGAAYSEVYNDIHGWAVQKIFNYSFQAAPDAKEIFRHMNPDELAKVRKAAPKERIVEDSATIDDDAQILEMDDDLEEGRPSRATTDASSQAKHKNSEKGNPIAKFTSHVASEWDKLGHKIGGEFGKFTSHLASEWDKIGHNIEGGADKIACGISKIFDHSNKKDCDKKPSQTECSEAKGGEESKSQPSLTGELLESYIDERMESDARKHIKTYLEVARPLLDELAGLFDEMNMDDPTKV